MMDMPLLEQGRNPDGFMNRWLREIARHVHSLHDILTTGDHDYSDTCKGMSHGIQTDKSFALPGREALSHLAHDRLQKPVLGKSILSCLVGRAKVNTLKPERRFDAAVKALMP